MPGWWTTVAKESTAADAIDSRRNFVRPARLPQYLAVGKIAILAGPMLSHLEITAALNANRLGRCTRKKRYMRGLLLKSASFFDRSAVPKRTRRHKPQNRNPRHQNVAETNTISPRKRKTPLKHIFYLLGEPAC